MPQLSRGELLEELLAVGGVMGAAFVSGEGEILESREAKPAQAKALTTHVSTDFTDVATLLSSCLASNRLLIELLGAEVASQTMLEFGAGALLLTRVTPDAALSVVALTSAADADRVRFGLRRLLPQLFEGGDDGEDSDLSLEA